MAEAKALADNPAIEAGDLAPLTMDEPIRQVRPVVPVQHIGDNERNWREYERLQRARLQGQVVRQRPPQHTVAGYYQGINLGGLPIPGFNRGAGNVGGQQLPPAPRTQQAGRPPYGGPPVGERPHQGGAVARYLAGHTAGPGTTEERRTAAIRAILARNEA